MDKVFSRPAVGLVDEAAAVAPHLGWHDYSKAFARHFGRVLNQTEQNKDTPLRLAYTLHKESNCAEAVVDLLKKKSELKPKYRDHALAIFTSLVLADTQCATGAVSFSRRPASYSVPRGYPRPLMRFQPTVQSIEALVASGLADETRGIQWPEGRGKRSTLRLTFRGAKIAYATDWASALRPVDGSQPALVIVKDWRTKQRIEPPCRSTYGSYEARLRLVNNRLASAYITIPDKFILSKSSTGRVFFVRNPVKPESAPVIVSPNARRQLRMPFLNDFAHGGRPVGWDAQILPRAVRRHCLLNNEPVSELDFQGSHIAIAYSLSGWTSPDCDPYNATTEMFCIPREVVKRAALCALNCSSIYQAEDALKSYMLTLPEFSLHHDDHSSLVSLARQILIHLQKVHHPIASYFFSNFGIRAQASEARMMLMALEEAGRRRFHIIPLHDGVICPRSRVKEVQNILKAAWFVEFGQKPPNIERKQEEQGEREGKDLPPYVERFLST